MNPSCVGLSLARVDGEKSCGSSERRPELWQSSAAAAAPREEGGFFFFWSGRGEVARLVECSAALQEGPELGQSSAAAAAPQEEGGFFFFRGDPGEATRRLSVERRLRACLYPRIRGGDWSVFLERGR